MTLPAGIAPQGRTHPTFVELGTNSPLYVHRERLQRRQRRYYVDGNPANTLAHYSSFRRIDVAGLRKQYAEAKALSPGGRDEGLAARRRARGCCRCRGSLPWTRTRA